MLLKIVKINYVYVGWVGHMKKLSILLLTVVFVSGCSFDRINYVQVPTENKNEKAGLGNSKIDFTWIKSNVFQVGQCLKCHGAGKAIDLSTYTTAMAAIGRDGNKLIQPGDYQNSKLYVEVESGRMPRGGPKLSEDLIYSLAVWINMGAFENGVKKEDPIDKPEEPGEVVELNFDFLKKKIFDPKCNTCHGPDGEAFYVDLTTREEVLRRVNLAEPDKSRIYKAVFSGRMPQGGPRMPDDEIAMILKWIETGAP